MRRDYVTLEVRDGDRDGDRKPTIELAFDGPSELLDERLVDANGDPLEGEEIDVAFRLQTPLDEADAAGVLSLTNRMTGDFVLEVNADADEILSFVGDARDADAPGNDEGRYRVEVRERDEQRAVYGKRTLLVYDNEGSLLRQHSLIPSGVEL